MLDNGCGVSFYEYVQMKSNMLNSIKENGGFWIGRYEAGAQNATKLNETRKLESGIDDKVTVQANQIPYNYVTCSQAQKIAQELKKDDGYTTSLLFGIQWDLVCKFLEVRGKLDINDITKDSSKWGNYSNTKINLSRGKYNINPGEKESIWKNYNEDTEGYVISSKSNNNTQYFQLLTTGGSEDTKVMNIYDFAGNVWEWTLEQSMENNFRNSICVCRGGYFSYIGSHFTAAYRNRYENNFTYDNFGFRIALY